MLATGKLWGVLSGVLAAALSAGECSHVLAADSVAAQKLKAEVARKQAEVKRKIEQRSREIKAATGSAQPGKSASSKNRAAVASTPPPAPFDAARAPSPTACFEQYVATAKSAGSMEQILPFLPESQQKALRARQSAYDPQRAAKNRQWHKQQDPKLSEQSLTHLSNPPFTNALKFHKGLADCVIKVLGEKIDGNKAKLVVSIHRDTTINGESYPFGTADVEMVGEGSLWRAVSFKPSMMVTKNPR